MDLSSADYYDSSAIRRVALEWIGRRMLRRLTAMWVVVWQRHFAIYDKTEDSQLFNMGSDLDRKGSHFFPGKSVETGRKPWNIELPIPPIWAGQDHRLPDSAEFPDVDRVQELWKAELYSWLPDGSSDSWAKIIALESDKDDSEDGNEASPLKTLFKKFQKMKDLDYQRRNGRQRLTKDAMLACCSDDEFTWINNVSERILSRNWLHPYTSHSCYELAYAAIWRSEKLEPIEFVYDQSLGQLKTKREGILSETFETFEKDVDLKGLTCSGESFPEIALASFNVKERFFRVRFVPSSDKRIFSIKSVFEVNSRMKRQTALSKRERQKREQDQVSTKRPGDKNLRPNSKGLFQLLCRVADSLGIELLRTSVDQKGRYSTTPHRQKVIEKGEITLVGRLTRDLTEPDQVRFKRCFESCVVEDGSVAVEFRDHISIVTEVIPWHTKTQALSNTTSTKSFSSLLSKPARNMAWS